MTKNCLKVMMKSVIVALLVYMGYVLGTEDQKCMDRG